MVVGDAKQVDQREALVRLARDTARKLSKALELRERQSSDRIGLTQLRGLLDACRQAVVVAEIEALLEYQRGRGIDDKGNRKSWATLVHGNQDATDVVLAAMKQVTAPIPEQDQAGRLAALARFFGYLYRSAVALKVERGQGA
jgi:streptomycin 6-kinase